MKANFPINPSRFCLLISKILLNPLVLCNFKDQGTVFDLIHPHVLGRKNKKAFISVHWLTIAGWMMGQKRAETQEQGS